MPVTCGGRRARVTLHAQFIRNQPVPYHIDLLAGERKLATWSPARARVWEKVAFGPFPWPDGAPLVLYGYGPHLPRDLDRLNGAVLDRVEIEWLD